MSDKPKPMDAAPALPDEGRYRGPSHASPYGLSRTAPSYALVDIAAEIEQADTTLAMVASGKLGMIAEQIRRLQEEARGLLARARRDAELHHATCAFQKKPGGEYHLYRKESGERWFSRIAPHEWVNPPAQVFEGTYRLELDMSFVRTDIEEEGPKGADVAAVRALLR